MENKKWIIAPLAGVLAAGLHFKYLSDLKAETTGGDRVEVLSMASNAAAGEKIQKESLASRMVPVSYVDERAVRASKLEEALGMTAAVDLKSGQTLLWTDFQSRTGAGSYDLAELIDPGQRAMTISVDSSLSMGGLLRPGHRVDILCTFGSGLGEEKHTAVLLQNVTVLAVGRTVGDAEEEDMKAKVRAISSFKTVTLAVDLEDAERLSLAAKQGVLSLALRGRQDLTVVQGVPHITAHELVGAKDTGKKTPAEALRVIERIQRR